MILPVNRSGTTVRRRSQRLGEPDKIPDLRSTPPHPDLPAIALIIIACCVSSGDEDLIWMTARTSVSHK